MAVFCIPDSISRLLSKRIVSTLGCVESFPDVLVRDLVSRNLLACVRMCAVVDFSVVTSPFIIGGPIILKRGSV